MAYLCDKELMHNFQQLKWTAHGFLPHQNMLAHQMIDWTMQLMSYLIYLWIAHKLEYLEPVYPPIVLTLVQEELSETIDSIQKYSTRLQDIRQKRKAMTMMMEAEGSNLREDFDDTNSEAASTMVSGMSAYTRGTESQTTGTQSLGVPSTIGGRLPEKKQRRVRSS